MIDNNEYENLVKAGYIEAGTLVIKVDDITRIELSPEEIEKLMDFLDKEIVRLNALIKECRANIKEQGEDFNRDNPNGGMYSKMELTEIHYEMEKQMIYAEEAARDIQFYGKLRLAPYFAKVVFKPDGTGKEKTVYIKK